MPDASEITRRANSNLAFALHILPRERREDMVVFYAFCRSMDDLADAPGLPVDQRRDALDAWRDGLLGGFVSPTALQRQVIELRDGRAIPTELLTAIIEGCQMDLQPQRFATWDELCGYIWKVACAVGLVSIRLFGCRDPASENYAVALARSLQLTNILRDIGEDYANGARIYLPLEDLARFHYGEQDLASCRRDPRFLALMNFQADRADCGFADAAASLPAADYQALAPARIMADIYHLLLRRMRRDGFRVFEQRYRVSRLSKISILAKHVVAAMLKKH